MTLKALPFDGFGECCMIAAHSGDLIAAACG